MISGKGLTEAQLRKLVQKDLALLAPAFRAAVERSIAQCRAAGLDVKVYETRRSNEVQEGYYALGRTVKPPTYTVTNAKTAMGSWHFYGLAVDVISESRGWFNDDAAAGVKWYQKVAKIFKLNGCSWGGEWKSADLPHFQWGKLKPSPSPRARALYESGGLVAVWREVGAADGPSDPVPTIVGAPLATRKLHLDKISKPTRGHVAQAVSDRQLSPAVAEAGIGVAEQIVRGMLAGKSAERIGVDILQELADAFGDWRRSL